MFFYLREKWVSRRKWIKTCRRPVKGKGTDQHHHHCHHHHCCHLHPCCRHHPCHHCPNFYVFFPGRRKPPLLVFFMNLCQISDSPIYLLSLKANLTPELAGFTLYRVQFQTSNIAWEHEKSGLPSLLVNASPLTHWWLEYSVQESPNFFEYPLCQLQCSLSFKVPNAHSRACDLLCQLTSFQLVRVGSSNGPPIGHSVSPSIILCTNVRNLQK